MGRAAYRFRKGARKLANDKARELGWIVKGPAPFFVCRPATSAVAIELSRFPRNPTPAVKTLREEYVQ